MSDATAANRAELAALDATKPGDQVPVEHDCQGLGSSTVRHSTPVLVTSIDEGVVGTRYRGVRCDGSRIEWVEER